MPPLLEAAPLTWSAPGRWLRLGASDLWRNPKPGLMHGAIVAVFGGMLLGLAHDQFWWLVGAFTGFLIVAPILATGLYAVSRAAERGQTVCCKEVLAVWASRDRRLVGFGVLLALAGTGWVLTSAGLITLWAEAPIRKPVDFVRHVVMRPELGLFEVWVLLGALLAAPVYASSVITLPMLVDRPVPLWTAVACSWRVVADQPVVMAVWALTLAVLVALGFATFMLGLVWVIPVLGHASWHAYRDLVPNTPRDEQPGMAPTPGA